MYIAYGSVYFQIYWINIYIYVILFTECARVYSGILIHIVYPVFSIILPGYKNFYLLYPAIFYAMVNISKIW